MSDRRMSIAWACLLFSFVALAACDRQTQAARPDVASALYLKTEFASPEKHQKLAALAYEHTVSIQLDAKLLPNRLRELQTACSTDQQFACTLLDVSLTTSDTIPKGSIRMRLAPGGVDAFIGIAAKSGKILTRGTHAEDLAEPVSDTERQLSLLTTHRDRLSELSKDRSLKVDQVIALSKELASVQTQIDALSNTRADLRHRIDTHLLSIDLSVPWVQMTDNQAPISEALRAFGTEFVNAVGQVIRFLASLIPWLVVIVPGMFFVRVLWRAIGRWLERREARP